MSNQYESTILEYENRMADLQHDVSRTHNELTTANIQVAELKKLLEDMRSKLKFQEMQKSVAVGGKEHADHTNSSLHKHLASLESKYSEAEIQIIELSRTRDELQKEVVDLQMKSSTSEQKAYDAALQVRESVQMVENAMMEKDQAIQREQQSVEEVDRLQESLARLLDEAGSRTREEVDNVRKQCNNNISRLMEEIHGLEMEGGERQTQLDRAIREKRAVESELEKIYQEGLHATSKEGQSIEELTQRACDAERRRDESILKLDSCEHEYKRLTMTCQQENRHLKTEVEQLKDRLTSINQEYELANDCRVKNAETIDQLKRKIASLQQERDSATRHMTRELSIMEADLRRKQKDYEIKLESVEDSHRHTMSELRQMLASQQRMSAKWKEECNTLTKKFESKLSELRANLASERKRTTELSRLLKDSTCKTAEAQQMLADYSRNIKRMEQRVRDAENRAATSGLQMRRELKQDRNIVEERRQLQRELERTLMESKISTSAPEILKMSDLGSNHH